MDIRKGVNNQKKMKQFTKFSQKLMKDLMNRMHLYESYHIVDWLQSERLWSPTRAAPVATLCLENPYCVFILVTAMIAAIIGPTKLLTTQPSHECFMSIFPWFQGNWEELSLLSVRVYSHDKFRVECQSFSDRCTVDPVRFYSYSFWT